MDAKKTFQVEYTTVKEEVLGQRRRQNIVKHVPGPRRNAKIVKTPAEAFSLFISDDMLNKIIIKTNTAIDRFLENQTEACASNKYPFYKHVDSVDIRAFIGLLYLRARLKLNLFDRESIWHHETANDFFESTMSLNLFVFISRLITFDERDTRDDHWKYDKFACMQDFFEEFNANNAKSRYPTPYLAVDETLYPYRGRIGFKQYNPSKPAKYGLLYRSLCDASVPYTYFTLPYVGKPEVLDQQHPEYKFYISGTDEYTKYLMEGFSEHSDILGCNVSMDRYFTSITLVRWATEKDFTIVGTMRLDRKGIPKEIKQMENREKSTFYVHAKHEEIMLVSYIDKKKSGKKNVRPGWSYKRSTQEAKRPYSL